MNRKEIEAEFGLTNLKSEELLERILEALTDENIDPKIKTRMQRYVRSLPEDRRLEEAVIIYSQKRKPSERPLEGEDLASYNRLAARLGLNQVLPKDITSDGKIKPLRRSRRLPVYWRVAAVMILLP